MARLYPTFATVGRKAVLALESRGRHSILLLRSAQDMEKGVDRQLQVGGFIRYEFKGFDRDITVRGCWQLRGERTGDSRLG